MYPVDFRFVTQNITIKKTSKDEKKFYISGYASVHSIIDRQDEIVTKGALEKAVDGLLKDGSTLFFNHDYNQPIGKIVKAIVDKKGLFIEAYLSKTRPDISGLVEEGILNKFSIGGKVTSAETERDRTTGAEIIKILEMELYEVSLVGVPANAKAEVIDYVLKSAVKEATKEIDSKGEVLKPYKNEHSARIEKPDKFVTSSFRSKKIATGVRIIIGKYKTDPKGKTHTQAYRFHVDHFSAAKAKKWLKDHDIKYILFEEAINKLKDFEEAGKMSDKTHKEKSIRDGIDKVIEENSKEVVEKVAEENVEEVVEENEAVKEEEKENEVVEEKEEVVEEEKEDDEEVEEKEEIEEAAEEKEEVEEEQTAEEKEEAVVEATEAKEDVEAIVEKTNEDEVDLVKTFKDKMNDIHKAVLGATQPRFTLFDKDVTEVIKDFDKLDVGDEVVLKIVCIVAEKAEAENVNGENTYKYLTLRTVEAEKVGSTKKTKDEKPTEVKSEEAVEQVVEEKIEEVVEEKKSKRKGINTDNLVEENADKVLADKVLAKKLGGKTVTEVMNDTVLYESLDEETKLEVKKLYKLSFFNKSK